LAFTPPEERRNDVVVIPNSAIAKMRSKPQRRSKRYRGTLTVTVDARNETGIQMEILKQAAMTCPGEEAPAGTVAPRAEVAIGSTYEISYSNLFVYSAGRCAIAVITAIYKRARPATARERPRMRGSRDGLSSFPSFFSLSMSCSKYPHPPTPSSAGAADPIEKAECARK